MIATLRNGQRHHSVLYFSLCIGRDTQKQIVLFTNHVYHLRVINRK